MNSFQISMLAVLLVGLGGGFVILAWGINRLRQAEESAANQQLKNDD